MESQQGTRFGESTVIERSDAVMVDNQLLKDDQVVQPFDLTDLIP